MPSLASDPEKNKNRSSSTEKGTIREMASMIQDRSSYNNRSSNNKSSVVRSGVSHLKQDIGRISESFQSSNIHRPKTHTINNTSLSTGG